MTNDPEADLPEADDRRDDENPASADQPTREPISPDRIAERAHRISQSDQAGSDEENWLRAERELREEQEQEEG